MDPYSAMNTNYNDIYAQPNPHGQMPGQPPMMVPQFSFRTMLRFVTELVAVIQGVAMIMSMITGWLKQQGGEPGPIRKLFLAVRDRVVRLLFGSSWQPKTTLDSAWASASQRPSLSWTQRVVGLYLAYAIFLEVKNYWHAVKKEQCTPFQAFDGVRDIAESGLRQPTQQSDNPTSNLLEFYVSKQRELYQQKKSQERFQE